MVAFICLNPRFRPSTVSLQLGNNQFLGGIPTTISQLTLLEKLYVQNAGLDTLPTELGGLASLKEFVAFLNFFTGTVPDFFGTMPALEVLELNDCSFGGQVPANLFSSPSLTDLSLARNGFVSSLPITADSFSVLSRLDMEKSGLTGTIPTDVLNLIALTTLNLRENQMSGSIPSELNQLYLLRQLYLDRNFFNGAIPSELGSIVSLEELTLSTMLLSGTVPTDLFLLTALQVLDLSGNGLTGNLPDSTDTAVWPGLRELRLNDLTSVTQGSIPSSYGNLLNLGKSERSFTISQTHHHALTVVPVSFTFRNLRLKQLESRGRNTRSVGSCLAQGTTTRKKPSLGSLTAHTL